MTARMTISLPDELKARMDAVQVPVNWSGVAARSFEGQLEQLSEVQRSGSLADVVERLRASRRAHAQARPREHDPDPYGEGLAAGMTWARATAECPELARLEAACGEADVEDWGTCPGLAEAAQAALTAGPPEEFWALHGPGPEPTPRFVQGFADGALAIFQQVKLQLGAPRAL